MKYSIFASFILFSLLSFASLSYARKEAAGDYWKGIMKDKPMPKALEDLLHEDDPDDNSKMNHFVKDFDLKSSAIIYHRHSEPVKEKQEDKSIKPEKLEVPTYTQELKDKSYQLNN